MSYISIADVYINIVWENAGNLWENIRWKYNPFIVSNGDKKDWIFTIYNYCDSDDIEVCDLLCQEYSGFFEWRVYSSTCQKYVWNYVHKKTNQIFLQYVVDYKVNKIWLIKDKTVTQGQYAFEFIGRIIHGMLVKASILTFHGVLMEHQNQGIIISAPSGTGKTTHARLWRDLKRALIINGDKSTCKKVDGVWNGYGLPWSGTSGEQINRNVPIKALVVLERGDYNEAKRIGGLEAFGAVLPHVQCPTWDKELADKAMELLDDFLNDIPIIRLRCRPDAESVEVLSKVLEEL